MSKLILGRNRFWFIAQDAAHSTLTHPLTVQTVGRHSTHNKVDPTRPMSIDDTTATGTDTDMAEAALGF
jgi:hypothetical protein